MVAAVTGWAEASQAGGRQAGRAYARKHFLGEQTLEMLADMRWQFATMLADTRFIAGPSGGGRRGPKAAAWADDPSKPWNAYATQPAVVSERSF